MLSLWRRHTMRCKFRAQGREWVKCDCPVWCDGEVAGRRVRQSLGTRDLARARRKLADLEAELESGRQRKPLDEAAASFLEGYRPRKPTRETSAATFRKYRSLLHRLADFAAANAVRYVDAIEADLLEAYARTREIGALTWSKELGTLRTFFAFCQERKWIDDNPAKHVKMPPNPQPKERPPYTPDEISRILAACQDFGRNAYERLRARAIVELMRFYGLRVSDVALLARDRIRNNCLLIRALKNGAMLWLPVYPEVARALECLPVPKRAEADCPYFFWSGRGSREGHINTVEATLQAMFRKSGVQNAEAHRFRHTLATKILEQGGTVEDVSDILGDSPEIIRKYYLHWSPARQARAEAALARVHGRSAALPSGTPLAQTENRRGSPFYPADRMVLEEGVEPSCPVKGAGF